MTFRFDGRSTGAVRIVVIGTGNPYRGDDAVGVVFSRRFREVAPHGVTVIEHDGEPAELLNEWAGADIVYLVDAVRADEQVTGSVADAKRRDTSLPRTTCAAGRVYRFDAHRDPLPAELFRVSTHAMGVAEGIELARVLDRLPQRLTVYGIRGDGFDHGAELSAEVDSACDEVVSLVLGEIRLLLKNKD